MGIEVQPNDMLLVLRTVIEQGAEIGTNLQ